jgi:Signal transduction histidine kinase
VLALPDLVQLSCSQTYAKRVQQVAPLERRANWPGIRTMMRRVGQSGVPEEMELSTGTQVDDTIRIHCSPVVGAEGIEAVYVWIDGPRLADEEVRTAARRTVEAKSRFLAAASHDLRQPFQAMRFFHSILAGHAVEPAARQAAEMLGRALASGEQLLDALLDISTLDAGTVKVSPRRFDLAAFLNGVVPDFSVEAAAKGLSFRVLGPDLQVDSDPALLERIVRNLLANAVRYTRQGGVLVGVRRRGGMARLDVWDTGFGIPDDEIPQIFEEFHQLENPERDRTRGLGLGLAIVWRLARLLGLPIKVHSRLGRGSVFSIFLPLAVRSDEPVANAAGETPMEMEARTVLVVEDDAMVLMGLQMILETWGLKVLPAEDMAQVLQCLDEARPDMILSDLRLRAGLTGFEVVERVRALLGQDIPAIILTGETGKSELAEGQRRHLTFLHKPIQADPLKAALQRAAESA